METRISITFDYPEAVDEGVVKEREDRLMEWAKKFGYVAPMITGSLFEKNATFSFMWKKATASENFDYILNAQAKIGDLFSD